MTRCFYAAPYAANATKVAAANRSFFGVGGADETALLSGVAPL